MNGLPYYKAYPRDFFEGTVSMPFDLKGAYRLILDMIYLHGGSLPDEPRFIAGNLGCSVRAWNGYRSALIASGKIVADLGIISNFRANKELDKLGMFQEKQREKASVPRKNKHLDEATAEPRLSQPEPEPEPYREVVGKPTTVQPDNSQRCVDHFNEVAARVGWPKVQKITTARKAALSQRIRDVGGADVWCEAMDRAATSPLLTGQNGRGWAADFDWLCKPANFTKLMEGNYDPKPANNTTASRSSGFGSATYQAFAAVAARHRDETQ